MHALTYGLRCSPLDGAANRLPKRRCFAHEGYHHRGFLSDSDRVGASDGRAADRLALRYVVARPRLTV